MFERLVSKVLSRILSKYFTEECLSRNKVATSAQLGVWSGYIVLKDLELKTEVINRKLRQKGLPFEIVHCSLRSVEITIPWAKLSNPINTRASSSAEDGVVVVVLDGIHLLARTNFVFDDLALRESDVKKRRQALEAAGNFVRDDNTGQTYAAMFKKRVADGLLQEVMDKLHLHLRDLHIRLEDLECDPGNPFACGITLESMHIQHDEQDTGNVGFISKVAMLNHFGVYWNPLQFGQGVPAENSILHLVGANDPKKIARTLDACISRRAKRQHTPVHTYILLPIDGSLNGSLSTDPANLRSGPAFEAVATIDSVSAQARDFQLVQMLSLASEIKNHGFVKKYRKFRPLHSVKENPRAWWLYAARVIRYQIRESFLRWSWSQFEQAYSSRARYMDLYERKLRFPSRRQEQTIAQLAGDDADILDRTRRPNIALGNGYEVDSTFEVLATTPDEGAGPSIPVNRVQRRRPLNNDEIIELQDLEDGIRGDLSVNDILMFRGVINLRLGREERHNQNGQAENHYRSSWWTQTVEQAASDDVEAQAEFDRLLMHINEVSAGGSNQEAGSKTQTSVSLALRLEELHIALFSPLQITSDETQLRRLHEKFLNLDILDIRACYSLKGDYSSSDVQLSVYDIVGTEIRKDRSQHVIAKQIAKESAPADGSRDSSAEDGEGQQIDPFMALTLSNSPAADSTCEIELVIFLNSLEFGLGPDCEFISKTRDMFQVMSKVPSVADYWDGLSMAYFNSIALGRLGLLAKAESAAYEHKNMDIEVTIQCPVLRIRDASGGEVVADLGIAQFKTERLAGISRSKLNQLPIAHSDETDIGLGSITGWPEVSDELSMVGSITVPTLGSRSVVSHQKRRSTRISSSFSVDRESFSGSRFNDDAHAFQSRDSASGKLSYGPGNYSALFYDVYKLQLQTGAISVTDSKSSSCLTTGFEILTTFRKSVIPWDHTLCKLKTHTIVNNLDFTLNQHAIIQILSTAKDWKSLLSTASTQTGFISRKAAQRHAMRPLELKVMPSTTEQAESSIGMESADDASTSQIDENEFFDANDGGDSFSAENNGLWFDDNWISDAESVMSASSNYRRGRRRQPSISDVSSASSQSLKGRRGHPSAYLSAENLARLEENAGEDESVDSGVDSDDGSFHSVLSPGGQADLLKDLDKDITDTEVRISELNRVLSNLRCIQVDGEVDSTKVQTRSKERRDVKLNLKREESELKALKALQLDLTSLVSGAPESSVVPLNEGAPDTRLSVSRMEHAKEAKALLDAKRRHRASMVEHNGSHNLTKNLNRELFQGSIFCSEMKVTIVFDDQDVDQEEPKKAFDFVASKSGIALFHYANEKKVYFSMDQMNASLRSEDGSESSASLLAAGTSDTMLPTHLPHLVSHSMEERFLRGAVYAGQRRNRNILTKMMKLRLVVGDVEVCPRLPYLIPIIKFVGKIRKAAVMPTNEPMRTRTSEIDGMASSRSILLSNPGSLRRQPLVKGLSSELDVERPASFIDFAIRFASVRAILSQGTQAVGAAAISEASLRFVQLSSSSRGRIQLDARCTNLQLLVIENLESGRGREIVGRRDPYNSIIQLRLRSQIVPSYETAGWAVGLPSSFNDNDVIPDGCSAQNVHIGVKINPLSLVASADGVSKLRACAAELKMLVAVASSSISSTPSSLEQRPQKPSAMSRLFAADGPRWRVDVSLRRVSVGFPSERKDEDWAVGDDSNTNITFSFTFAACLQQSAARRGCLSLETAVTETSLIRVSDEWPIIEPFSISSSLDVQHDFFSHEHGHLPPMKAAQLKISSESPLNEIATALRRSGISACQVDEMKCDGFRLMARVTPIRGNYSGPIIGLLVDTLQSLKPMLTSKRDPGHVPVVEEAEASTFKRRKYAIQVTIESMEHQLLKEADARSIAHAESLVSFVVSGVTIGYENDGWKEVSVSVHKLSLFDLSSTRGIRVVGEDPGRVGDDDPDFLNLIYHMNERSSRLQKTSLEIRWGHVQCLVLPSFFRSMLSLVEEIKGITQSTSKRGNEDSAENLLTRLVQYQGDFNFVLAADAKSFECILSSKDIDEHIRSGSQDPIGVVAFRWTASLNVAVALDSLQGSSTPWVTLNANESFADHSDISLFKDFSDRYFAPSSGFFAGSDEIGRRLKNAFTAKVALGTAGFQILRTNIESTNLETPTENTGLSYKSANRMFFKTCPPLAGEQRITNEIDLNLAYRSAGVTMSTIPDNELVAPRIEMSQLLEIKANFVDVLLYISQSSEGFTEAYRVSVKPVMNMLKAKDARRMPEDEVENDLETSIEKIRQRVPTPVSLLRNTSTICTMKFEGFQVTCVPGGATRLNESPIIKFEVSNFASGLAGTPVPKDVRLLPGRSQSEVTTTAQEVLSGVDVMHMTLAGWLICDISAHYHNRRLVAWEPFIEPWVADLSFGVDLVEALKLQPSMKAELGELKSISIDDRSSNFDPFGTQSASDGTGDRFRDFGRLFRAPFQNSSSSKPAQDGCITHADLSYLMMASTSRSTMLSALGPTSDNRSEKETRLFACLPGRRPMEWLYGFGRAGFLQKDRRESSAEQYSVSALLSDERPLNINLTGALIENVLGYLENVKRDEFKAVAPHWIRNDTGMTIRFQEVLDVDRAKRGDLARCTTLENGCEVPLTLMRSLSQSCDPHRAYIHLELGNFEDTVGRVRHDDFDIPKGSRSSFFFFKTAAKIPVDTVGVHRYPLDRNAELRPEAEMVGADSRSLGWIIVRVALRGGKKIVSVESPFVLKSTVDADLLCEIRDHNGLSLLWRCLVPKSGNGDMEKTSDVVSVPADIVPFIHHGSYRFSVMAISRGSSLAHEAEFVNANLDRAIEIATPPPFSPESFAKGVIGEEEIALSVSESHVSSQSTKPHVETEMVHLSVCAARIGSWAGVKSSVDIPEQRMLFFRAPFVVRNCLALPIAIQVRVKRHLQAGVSGGITRSLSANRLDHSLGRQNPTSRRNAVGRRNTFIEDWEDLGVLDCGEQKTWTGALSYDTVQVRAKFVGTDGDNSRRFPGWSSALTIPPKEKNQHIDTNGLGGKLGQMKVSDADNIPLYLSVALEGAKHIADTEHTADENIRLYSQRFLSATRMVSIFVPYWIVDGTNQDLEFFSGAPVAGQLDRRVAVDKRSNGDKTAVSTSGLAELLDNDSFINLPSSSNFDVMMIGDEKSSRLTVRKRLARTSRRRLRMSSPWSDPIPLQAGQDSIHDINVLSRKESSIASLHDNDDGQSFDRLVLRSSVVTAPERFGGLLGTKLIQVVNSYSVLNETGRDIEIVEDGGRGSQIVIKASGLPQAFHFDDSKSVRFRFKEFGWTWSGHFKIRLNRREVTMRLHHKMKGHTVIVTMEVRSRKKSSTSLLIFRQSTHPPFRLENHTMHPLHFGQSSARVGLEESDVDAMLLPYQSADFAWDEPESRRRALIVKSTGLPGSLDDCTLGRFQLDRIAPGTILKIESALFTGEIVADGPTRVLRISDASMPRVSSFRQEDMEGFQKKQESGRALKSSFLMKLTHGIGVSVVDWSPQELLYVRLEDIQIERQLDSKTDTITFSVGNIKLNNQLWVTPYPVLLKMGRRSDSLTSRKRNRRHDAITVSWRRALNTHGGYGNLTLLEYVEFSSEPIFFNVDGKLAGPLARMIQRVKGIGSHDKGSKVTPTRDEELRALLDLGSESSLGAAPMQKEGASAFASDVDDEHPATAAMAAKLKTQPFTLTRRWHRGNNADELAARKEKSEMLTKPEHKFYIEKLKVSAIKADLSWSGALPGVVSSLLLRALTFERLPIRLRPYSSSHSYGNTQDHLQSLKSHYLSFWRMLDLLMGISYNPTFLFRAVVYTCRESLASALDSLSSNSSISAKQLSKVVSKENEFQPTYDDGLPMRDLLPKSDAVKKAVLGPLVKVAVGVFTSSSDVAGWLSSLARYDAQSGGHHETRGLVRSRNPRLFAHVDGMDLLVGYVEGENAGKALLSRVRMGKHLGEGYVFHTEGARQQRKTKTTPDVDRAPCIFMITSERILLLDGRLDEKFCTVIWESKFLDIVHLELLSSAQVPSMYDGISIWYLVDSTFDSNASEERASKFAKAVVSGINILNKQCVLVPSGSGEQLVAKMRKIDKRLHRSVAAT